MMTAGSRPPWNLVYGLVAIIIFQWYLFTLLANRQEKALCSSSPEILPPPPRRPKRIQSSSSTSTTKPVGVAVTVLFRAPKWFHLRYNVMISNMLANLPPGWKLQIFTNQKWLESQVLQWQPGLTRLLRSDRIVVTSLPDSLIKGKPKMVMVSEWFWQNLVADRVFLFSGNGAICGNHNTNAFERLAHFDYVGSPNHGKDGGSGEFSFRNRTAMLEVLQYAKATKQEIQGTEYGFFLDLMNEMNSKQLSNFSIGTRDDTLILGSTRGISNATHAVNIPLIASGTQASLSYVDRDTLLKHCPELKVIFPSLHEPACFGAHPKPEICRASIRALGEIPPSGC